jgi:type VI protein secretion system component VasF
MNVTELFRHHLLLTARLQAGKPLTRGDDVPTAVRFEELIERAEARPAFTSGRAGAQSRGVLEQAEFAVYALIDQVARSKFKGWTARNSDTHVGATFYRNLLARRNIPQRQNVNDELQDLYVLCILLGHQGEHNLRESAEVKQAVRDVVTVSAAKEFNPVFAPLPERRFSGEIQTSHSLAARAVALLVVALFVAAVLVWTAWVGFPNIGGEA